jgi:hypothetical protein
LALQDWEDNKQPRVLNASNKKVLQHFLVELARLPNENV